MDEDQALELGSALNRARQLAGKPLPKSALLSLVCMDFLATNDFRKADDSAALVRYLSKLEALLGKKLVAIDTDTREVAYGFEVLEAMASGD